MSIDWKKLYSVANDLYWMHPSRNRYLYDRDDAVQEAMLCCWKYRHKWDQKGKEAHSTFFYRVIRWAFKDCMKRAHAEIRNPPDGSFMYSIQHESEFVGYDYHQECTYAHLIHEDCRTAPSVDHDEVRRLRNERIIAMRQEGVWLSMVALKFDLSIPRIKDILKEGRECKNKTH